MQRLAHIDVAEAGHDLLVGQRRLEARRLAGAGARQHGRVERSVERLGPDLPHQRMLGELIGRHQQHQPEAARIVEDDAGAGRHVEHDMVVRPRLRARVVEAARRLRLALAAHAERAGHAEMHHQHVARGEFGKQIFRPPRERGDGRPFQPPGEIVGQRPAQVGPVRFDRDEARAHHRGRQAAADRLDLRQFGHLFLVLRSRRMAASRRTGPSALMVRDGAPRLLTMRKHFARSRDSALTTAALWSPRMRIAP